MPSMRRLRHFPPRPFLRAALSRAPFSALDCLKKLLDVLSGVQRV